MSASSRRTSRPAEELQGLLPEVRVSEAHHTRAAAAEAPLGSKEWYDTYRVDRNSSESQNKLLQKDQNLENTTSRPMHGLAAQQFALALFAVASNMRRIIQYEHDVSVSSQGSAASEADLASVLDRVNGEHDHTEHR